MQRFLITPEVDQNFLAHFEKLAKAYKRIDFAMYRSSDYSLAREFASICAQNKITSILNILDSENIKQDLELISEFDGIHLKGKDFSKITESSAMLDSEFASFAHFPRDLHTFKADFEKAKILGFSAHCIDELKNAISLGAHYCFLSPIFGTPNKGAPLGIETLQKLDSQTLSKTFALGGIITDSEILQLQQIPHLQGFASIRYFQNLSV